jgi:hypothetical protein
MIVCWWSGGVTSAVACKIALDLYGKENCRIIMIDTKNEDDDTYRFYADCQIWYNKEIEIIRDGKIISSKTINLRKKDIIRFKEKRINTNSNYRVICAY